MTAARAMTSLLEEERSAVRRADLERLLELQEKKRELVAAVGEEASKAELEQIRRLARENVALMRHLTDMLEVLVTGKAGATYGAYGQKRPSMLKNERGWL
jgi:hypothetical protein